MRTRLLALALTVAGVLAVGDRAQAQVIYYETPWYYNSPSNPLVRTWSTPYVYSTYVNPIVVPTRFTYPYWGQVTYGTVAPASAEYAGGQAASLLFAQPCHRGMKASHAFAFQELAFGRLGLRGGGSSQLRVEGLLGMLPGTDFEAEIVRHAEDPGTRVLNLFPFAQRDIQTQEDFLCGFLCLRRIETQGEKIPVNVVPRLFEQTGDLVLQRRTGLFLAYQTCELFVGRE